MASFGLPSISRNDPVNAIRESSALSSNGRLTRTVRNWPLPRTTLPEIEMLGVCCWPFACAIFMTMLGSLSVTRESGVP